MSTVINQAGYVITTPGEYVLDANLSYSGSTGAAITVACSNVTIDLAGHTITGNGRDDSLAYGIRADGQTDVDVRNGTLSGFYMGVSLNDNQAGLGAGGFDVSNLDVLDSTFRGVLVSGASSRVTDCYINGVSGSVNHENSFAVGIELFGDGGSVLRNEIREIHPIGTGEGLGISISSNSDGTTVSDNSIINRLPDGRSSYGVWVGGDSTVVVQDNVITNYAYGFAFSSPTAGAFVTNAINGWYEAPFVATSHAAVDGGGNIIRLTGGNDTFAVDDYYVGPQTSAIGFSIIGDAGNDDITGTEKNDTLMGGYGADVLDGGAGVDTASFADAAYGTFQFSFTDPQLNTGPAAGDTFISIENVTMSRGNDLARGDARVNVIRGQDGNDRLFGMDNDDRLYGENGNDILFGGPGADLLDGGAGFDYAAYDDASNAAFTVSLTSPSLNTGVAGGDTFVGVEGLILSNDNDTACGDATANYIYGRAGDDTLSGYAGNDNLFGELGADTFLFNTRANSTTNCDTIGDFQSGIDMIGLAELYFGAAEDASGNVRLYEGAGITGRDVHALIGAVLFDTATGALYYDADGGGRGAEVQFATLTNVSDVQQHDFFFV